MKNLITLIGIFIFTLTMAQNQYNYDKQWKTIEKQEKEGLSKSSLDLVNQIYAQAVKDDNPQQKFKALLYQSKIILNTSDDENIELTVVDQFNQAIQSSKGVEKAIFQSFLAEMYEDYYANNSYKINKRTELAENEQADFRYWTSGQFQQKIGELYELSLENEAQLKNEYLKDWEYILMDGDGKEYREFRPTLYDLLAHRAIAYFKNEGNYSIRFDAEASQERKEKWIGIIKSLILEHNQKHQIGAAAYNDWVLLSFLRPSLKDDDFERQLLDLNQTYNSSSFSPYLLLELAKFYQQQINKADSKDFDKRKELSLKSIAFLDQIIQNYPRTGIKKEAEKAKKAFYVPYFSVHIENYLIPNQNTLFSIIHKNTDKLYFKILRYDENKSNLVGDFRYGTNDKKSKALRKVLNAMPSVSEYAIELKSFDDFQNHQTVAKFNPLEVGKYLVLISNRADFDLTKDETVFKYQIVNVSRYSIVSRGNTILVTERETGKPSANQEVLVEKKNSGIWSPYTTVSTDQNGLAHIVVEGKYQQEYRYRIKDEAVYYNQHLYREYETTLAPTYYEVAFFTDRKIYRPGQVVYFKAIVYTIEPDGKRKIAPNYQFTSILKDVNWKEVKQLSLTTNEFGSVSGEFMLPTSGLTGNFYLAHNLGDSHYNFSVEEYKRPKFEVKFDDIKETFRLEENISIHGHALAYSGANIDGAKVVYRVYRQAIYPYRPWWMRSYFEHEPAEEISQGETTTDQDGKFHIAFQAKPGKERKEGEVRTYIYQIIADVTDLNGETRSSEQSVTIGDLRYRLKINLDDKIELDELNKLKIITENLNGQFAAAQGEISLYKINPPNRILRESPIQKGDYELYAKNEFIGYFPNEAYGDENLKENWQTEKPVLDQVFNTALSQEVSLNTKKWKEGYYVLKAWIVDGDEKIPYEQLVYLYKNDKKNPVDNELFAIEADQLIYKPGDKAKLQLSSATQDSEVLIQLEVDGKMVKTEKIKLNQSVQNYVIPIEENHVGNIFVHYYFGKFNTAKPGVLTLSVPPKDTSLKITTSTLRDKLQPGENEIWELTVSGADKDKVMAEMLTTMYDASLDQFRSNNINFPMFVKTNYIKLGEWNTRNGFSIGYATEVLASPLLNFRPSYYFYFDRLNDFGFYFGHDYFLNSVAGYAPGVTMRANNRYEKMESKGAQLVVAEAEFDGDGIADSVVLGGALMDKKVKGLIKEDPALNQIVARKALQETAFFYPNLRTDENGNIKIQFTVPESLTEWKFMAMAHTPELNTGYFETKVRTQKDLMVFPNPPRFLREGDEIVFSTKISNLSDKVLSGQAKLMLFDAFTMEPIDGEFDNAQNLKTFKTQTGQSDVVSWSLKVSTTRQAIVYRVVASAGDFSDGEEAGLPILTNRMMVTETMPMSVREGQTKTFSFDKLKNNQSRTLDHFKLTFEMTTNPIWYAIFSLPYLREYPYECSEQVFSRLYGNLISEHLINSNPKIKAVFDDWNRKGELKSKLEQNEELKSILLEETPWVRQAENEEEQMKRIAVLFDLNQMQNELTQTFSKLKSKQSASGGFPWFEGGNESVYITTQIVSGFGHLQAMNIDYQSKSNGEMDEMLKKAIAYLDHKIEERYKEYQKDKRYEPSTESGIYWLYARSQFLDQHPLNAKGKEIRDFFLRKAKKEKFDFGLQTQAMLALVFNRYNDKKSAVQLVKSIKDHSIESDEMGMYWKNNVSGWSWFQAPIETQAMLIEAFDEVTQDTEAVEAMKVWLLKNRQTNRWVSTKATTEAVFALMNTGKDWTNSEEGISVQIGGKNLDLKNLEKAPQSGTGYIKTSWNHDEIQAEMGEVKVEKTSPGVAWGAMYWQYFEDLDQITQANTSVRFRKELYLKKNTDKGVVLTPITESTPIQIGDLVSVRLEIQTDRAMEFVHLKDMRASGFEPVNVISRFKWQDGLGYYESTRDAATNFFIDYMPKGTYVFEYDVRANNAGNFSNGITSLQNMYAPEFSAHSEGIRVKIKE